ncbi:MAG TPA: glycosyltransferase family protein [Bacteroidia bacterium]|jgi:uncharacterized protein (TIGR00661 family)|nr:glycosyltransferase family protein [Bacteroidia bacterium]
MKLKKKIVLTVQGEGRGHLTQAISLCSILENGGYEIAAVMVGSSSRRELPAFFRAAISAPLITFQSPNFVTDRKNKSIRIRKSLLRNFMLLPTFFKSMRRMEQVIEEHNPVAIINLYDPLTGLFSFFKRPSVPVICVAHQYLLLHPDFDMPAGHRLDKFLLRAFTRLTSYGAIRKLAISFYPMSRMRCTGITVVPPLLRKEVFEQIPQQKGHFLIYLLNKGYREDVIRWHEQNQETETHVFCDSSEKYETVQYGERLFFHRLNDRKFLGLMAGAKGLISTAGFESICEAMYMQAGVRHTSGRSFRTILQCTRCRESRSRHPGFGIQHCPLCRLCQIQPSRSFRFPKMGGQFGCCISR